MLHDLRIIKRSLVLPFACTIVLSTSVRDVLGDELIAAFTDEVSMRALEALAKAYEENGEHQIAVISGSMSGDHNIDVIVSYTKVDDQKLGTSTGNVRESVLGTAQLVIIANKANPVDMLKVSELRSILTTEKSDVTVEGWPGREIRAFVAPDNALSVWMLRQEYLRYEIVKYLERRSGWLNFAKSVVRSKDDDAVGREVSRTRNAVGVCLRPQDLWRNTKFLKLVGDEKKRGDRCREVRMHLVMSQRSQKDLADDFYRFACGPQGSSVLEKQGLTTTWRQEQYERKRRLDQAKAGKGTRLLVAGDGVGEKAIDDLATEYARAKDVIQLRYGAVDSDVIAVGQFVADSPRRELLVLGDRPSERAMEIHSKKWDSLGRDENGQPDGTGPAEHVLAGRAVAVIVNPANKLDSLTLGQLKAIFGGEVKDWAIVGGTGLEAADQKVAGATIPINLYGLRANNEATAVFEKECLARNKWVGVEAKADTAEAVAAVSMDPQAMAFVDLSAIPGITLMSLSDGFAASGQNVKVLAVTVGTGDGAKTIKPSPENIRNAMYPLSQRLYMYVHPEASETAKDFSKFVSTCGGSEETPYADTVKGD